MSGRLGSLPRRPSSRPRLRLLLASPRGFCVGVDRAIRVVQGALGQRAGRPVYVRHEIVHNRGVVEDLERQSVVFKLPDVLAV